MTYKQAQDNPEWLKAAVRREAAALRTSERAEKRRGKPHPINPADPWSLIERGPCFPGCGHD